MDSTLYPKITNHIKEVLKSLEYHLQSELQIEGEVKLESVPLVGTIKLHGTHADILIYPGNRIVLQSRNKPNLKERADNHGFAKAMSTKKPVLLKLRDRFITRWKELNPGCDVAVDAPITIAGEWIGEGIQKGVALMEFSKRLVIISTKINEKWVDDEKYGDIHAEKDGIYNISRGGYYHSALDPNDLTRTTEELERLAEDVAAKCPFAESFGVIGNGEGIVWKLQPYMENERLWFKTKGGYFKPNFAPVPKQAGPSEDVKETRKRLTKDSAEAWCSEMRMEQGVDWLREKHLPQDMKGLGLFLHWLTQDIFVEEKMFIEENSVDEKMFKAEIIRITKPWYTERCSTGV